MKTNKLILVSLVSIALLVSLAAAEAVWPAFQGNLQHTGLSQYDTSGINGAVKWAFETGEGIESSPTIAEDGTIYFGSHDGYLYALNSDGTLNWKFKPAEPIYNEPWQRYAAILSSPAIAVDGTVYVIAPDDYLHAVKDGKEKWRFPLKWNSIDFWASATIGSDGTIYVGSARTEDTDAGLVAGFYALTPEGKEKWHYVIDAGVTSAPAIATDGTIYVNGNVLKKTAGGATAEGYVFAFNTDGTLKWRFKLQDWVESSPSIAVDGTVYTGSKEGRVYALNPADGSKKWEFVASDGIGGAPAIAKDGTLYVGSWDNNMYALAPDGKEKWRFPVEGGFETIGASAVIGAEGTVYFGTTTGILYALNPDGTEKWRLSGFGSIASSPAIGEDGTLYVGAWNKKFYALGAGEAKSREVSSEIGMECHEKQLEREVRFNSAPGNTCIEGTCDSYSTICQKKMFDGSCSAPIEVCVSKNCKKYRSYCNLLIKNLEPEGPNNGFTAVFKQNYVTKDGQKHFIKEMKAFLLPGQERSIAWQYEVAADQVGSCDYSDLANPICEPEEEVITWNFTTERTDGAEDRGDASGPPEECIVDQQFIGEEACRALVDKTSSRRSLGGGPPEECIVDGEFIGEDECSSLVEKTPMTPPAQETKGFLRRVIEWFVALFR